MARYGCTTRRPPSAKARRRTRKPRSSRPSSRLTGRALTKSSQLACTPADTPDGPLLGAKLLYLGLPSDTSGADARRRVSVQRCKPCANPHDRGATPKYLPAELTQYLLNNFSNNPPPYRVTQDDVLTLSSTTRSGEDHRTPIGSQSRWEHRGGVQDALDGSFWTVLEAGDGPPAFLPRVIALLGGHSESAPPNQPPVPPDVNWCCTTGTFSEQRRAFPGARLRLRSSRRMG